MLVPKLPSAIYGCCIVAHELESQGLASHLPAQERIWSWARTNQQVIHSDKLALFTPAVERMNAMGVAFKVPFLRRIFDKMLKKDITNRGCFSVSNFGAFSAPDYPSEYNGLKLQGLYIGGSGNFTGPSPLFMAVSINNQLYV